MTPASLAALHSRVVRAHVSPPPPWGSRIVVETADLLSLFALAAANRTEQPPEPVVRADTALELRDLRAENRELEARLLYETAQRQKWQLEAARLEARLKAKP